MGLLAASCSEPGSAPLAEGEPNFPSPDAPSVPPPAEPAPRRAEPAQICVPSSEGVPALRGEAPPPYQVKLPECGRALAPVELEGFDRDRLVDSLDAALVAPVGEQVSVTLAFTNEGDQVETFSANWRGPSPFQLDAPPAVVSPGGTADWTLTWTPSTVGRLQAELEVRRGERTERLQVEGVAVEAAELGCRIDVPAQVSREEPLFTEVLCENRSSVPVRAERLRLTKSTAAESFELRAAPRSDRPIEVPPLGLLRWPVELCPQTRGVIGLTVQLEASTLQRQARSASVEATSAIVGPQLQISQPPVLRPTPGALALPVRFELRNSGLEPVDLLSVETPPDLRWQASMNRRVGPGRTEVAELLYVGTGAAPRTLEVELATSVGLRTLALRVEPESPSGAGTDCIDDLAGFPEAIDLGVLGDDTLQPLRAGSFTLENRGTERCQFGLRGEGAVQIDRDLDLLPGERILVPIDLETAGGTCALTGGMTLLDPDDWRPRRRFALQARLDPDGPRFSMRQNILSCVPPGGRSFLLELEAEEEASIETEGLSAFEDYPQLFGPTDCERLNGHVRIQAPNGQVARLPVGLGPSLTCGEAFEVEREFQVDAFTTLSRTPVDLIWILDDSISMGPFWPDLGPNLESLVEFLEAQDVDARLFLRRTSGPWVTDETGAPRAFDFGAGSPKEELLTALAEIPLSGAFEPTIDVALDAAISPVLRRDAVLSLVAVTNEADQSSSDVNRALNHLFSIKGFRNTQLVSFSVVSGSRTGCEPDGALARPAPSLVELADRSGGIDGSICSETWSRGFEEYSQHPWGYRRRFFLTQEPIIQSIQVRVEDEPLPATEASGQVNWTYDFSTNSVNFLPLAVPGADAQIRIRYQLGCR